MKCKCGKDAELMQMNIFDEEEPICRECFSAIGQESEQKPQYEDDLFYASRMGGDEIENRGMQIKIEDFER